MMACYQTLVCQDALPRHEKSHCYPVQTTHGPSVGSLRFRLALPYARLSFSFLAKWGPFHVSRQYTSHTKLINHPVCVKYFTYLCSQFNAKRTHSVFVSSFSTMHRGLCGGPDVLSGLGGDRRCRDSHLHPTLKRLS